jgi:hypothetical protein
MGTCTSGLAGWISGQLNSFSGLIYMVPVTIGVMPLIEATNPYILITVNNPLPSIGT